MREKTWIIYAQSGALAVEGLQQAELAQPATDLLENKKKVGGRARYLHEAMIEKEQGQEESDLT
jgi:hypothetical protein